MKEMSEKMLVVFVEKTGHTLGVVTRAADPEGKPKASDLFVKGLLVSNAKATLPTVKGGEQFVVSPAALDVAVVDFDSEVFGSPLNFAVGGGTVAKLGNVLPSIGEFKTNHIKVSVAIAAGADGLGVWVQVEERVPPPGKEPERRVMAGNIAAGLKDVTLDLTIEPGGPPATVLNTTIDYSILVLVAGQRALIDAQHPS
jgi:hypothetical protein